MKKQTNSISSHYRIIAASLLCGNISELSVTKDFIGDDTILHYVIILHTWEDDKVATGSEVERKMFRFLVPQGAWVGGQIHKS